jgi:uncharacterized coiled-coil protein SlyX
MNRNPDDPAKAMDRIARLEAELAFQGDALRELSDTMAKQQLDLIDARREVSHLVSQLAELRGRLEYGQGEDGDERPPHY